MAVLNLDWYKAFDLVPVDFVFKILQTLGFGEQFVNWIKILYTGIESALDINNILSDFFSLVSLDHDENLIPAHTLLAQCFNNSISKLRMLCTKYKNLYLLCLMTFWLF